MEQTKEPAAVAERRQAAGSSKSICAKFYFRSFALLTEDHVRQRAAMPVIAGTAKRVVVLIIFCTTDIQIAGGHQVPPPRVADAV